MGLTEVSMTAKVSTGILAIAILHTFCVSYFRKLATKFREGSVAENIFHLLGEVEVVFGIWAAVFVLSFSALESFSEAKAYLNGLHFTEPLFVFVILVICSTEPILKFAESLIMAISHLIPFSRTIKFYFAALAIGPLLGSFITEPAAMALIALILADKLFRNPNLSVRLKYMTLGLLFVNISVGGSLTPYAAPPVLMVASKWGWDLKFMLLNFGTHAVLATFISTILVILFNFKELKELPLLKASEKEIKIPIWIKLVHLAFLAAVVIFAHEPVLFIGVFLFFLGVFSVTKEYQKHLALKEGLLVGFFLAGLVVLGGPQGWWIQPLIASMSDTALFLGATALTAITDNAALTYLGSQVQGLSDSAKFFLVAGALTGGGLTVIANAPNPAGYGILNPFFGQQGISAKNLFLGAILPTTVTIVVFLLV